jgi:hypothetical protein
MTPQDKSSAKRRFPPGVLQDLHTAYRTLDRAVSRQPWLVHGSVNVVAPKSPGGNVTYTWTRKVRAKTVTVALSKRQAHAFRAAIASNRRLEQALTQLREVSQTALLAGLPGVSRRRADLSRQPMTQTVPKGA